MIGNLASCASCGYYELQIRDGFEKELTGRADFEDADKAGLKFLINRIAVDRFDAVLPECVGIVGQIPDRGPEQLPLREMQTSEQIAVAGGRQAVFFNCKAEFRRLFFTVDAPPEIERALFSIHNGLAGKGNDECVEVNYIALNLIFLFENRLERIVTGRFNKANGRVELTGAGFLPDDFGVPDLVFVCQRCQ